jgi:hypothetical protein
VTVEGRAEKIQAASPVASAAEQGDRLPYGIATRTAWDWTKLTSRRKLQMILVFTPLNQVGRGSHASKSAKIANEVCLVEVSTGKCKKSPIDFCLTADTSQRSLEALLGVVA